ncbi:MAG: ATP-grasp domain-containing protein [Bacteroidales bacterium]|nr:ATP-grasp domain-containing protein [Bacteroidales bacterium]
MNNNNKPGVIVIGGHVQGLGIIRVFGKNNIPVILLDDTKHNIGRYSRYLEKFFFTPKNQILDQLLILKKENCFQNWLILPTNDFQVKILSQNFKELSGYFKISTAPWDIVIKCYNKINTYKIAKSLEIDIPDTFFPKDKAELKNIEIEFPCIIKPAVMHTFHEKTKKKVLICKNKEELAVNYDRALHLIPRDEIIIQEIIKGSSYNQYSACFLYTKNKIINCITVRRKRQHPIDFGNATTYAETVEITELKEKGEKLLNSINYNGICEIEFKYDDHDKKYKFLEINPRTWKWHYISEAAKVPFLLNLYKLHNNLNLEITETWQESAWTHILTDVFIRFLHFIKRQKTKKEIRSNKIYAVWDTKDLKPFIMEKLLLVYLIIKR